MPDGDDRLVAVVGGSHNCSGAAWGVGEDNMSVIMSYEAGVLVACGAGRRARILDALPWRCPAPPYDLDGGVEPCVFRGPFLADTDGGLRAVVARRTDVPVFRESLEAYVDRVGRKKEQDELKKLGKLCAQGLSPNRQAADAPAGERVFVDHGTAHFDYDHARYGKIHVTEYRLSDGSGFAHTGSGPEADLDVVASGDGDAKPVLAIFFAAGAGPPPTLRAALDDPRVAARSRTSSRALARRRRRRRRRRATRRRAQDLRLRALPGDRRRRPGRAVRRDPRRGGRGGAPTPRRCSRCSRRRGDADEALVRVRKRDEKKRRDALAPLENAKAAAAWVRRNYDVVVIEPGHAEAASVLTIRPEPLSASELSRDKADHFKDEAVPLLRELVAEPRVAVALATVWGQSVADRRSRRASARRRTASSRRSRTSTRASTASSTAARASTSSCRGAARTGTRNYPASYLDRALEAAKPPPESDVAAAVAGGPEACARRIFDEDEAFEGGAPPSTVPRALVVGAEHDTAATARAALDYIGVGKLCSGTGLDWKKVRWDSDAAGDDAIINFPNG
ncbi:tyrosyl-DNA phosphodiesterase [Aureococcus anophagefferens]|nr:tyrosyl-DNA phosphodiesterase [Aureococcus anophagefferens]